MRGVHNHVFRSRLTPAQERQVIVEEVTFLIDGGYRQDAAKQIREGMRVAQAEAAQSEWNRWSEMFLHDVVEDFYHFGTP